MSLSKSQALNAAREYVQQNNPQAAIDLYQKIIEADPTDLTTINTLGDLYVSTGRLQDAVDHFARVADGYLQSGFTRKAIAVLKKILTIDATNIESGVKLAEVYAQTGLPNEARQHYLQIADACARKGQMRDVLRIYPKIVDLDPSNASTRIKLGELYLREGLNEQAYEAFTTAAKQLVTTGENRRALNAYNEALAVKPDSTEASEAVVKLTRILRAAEAEKQSQSAGSVDSASRAKTVGDASPSGASVVPRASLPLDHRSEASDSAFVVQEISKAEILVAYGKVDLATSMLRNVLNKLPDNIEVHIKLKDIFLRTGMMTEAAEECRQLERIYQARGDEARARDYAVRASRLGQLIEHPSGDLHVARPTLAQEPGPRIELAPSRSGNTPHVPVVTSRLDIRQVQPMLEAGYPEKREPRVVPAPARSDNTPDVAGVTSKPDMSQVLPMLEVGPITEKPEARVDRAPSRHHNTPSVPVVTSRLAVSQTHSRPIAPATSPNAPSSKLPIELDEVSPPAAPLNFVCEEVALAPIGEVKADALITVEPATLETSRPAADSSVSVLPTLIAVSSPVEKKRGRFSITAIAAVVLVLLTAGAVVGGFFYNTHLDTQYETLASAATSLSFPSPPSAEEYGESEPVQAEGESMTVVVAPTLEPDTTPRTQKTDREVIESLQPAPLQPVASEPPRIVARPLPTPPRTVVSSDSQTGTENRTPAGVPIGVPSGVLIDPVRPVEPPPKTVRRSPGVVLGGAVKRVEPVYPTAAKHSGQSGVVSVEVTINEQGNVTACRAISGPPLLRTAAVSAARGWKFKPPTLGGVPMKTTTVIAFNFKLQ